MHTCNRLLVLIALPLLAVSAGAGCSRSSAASESPYCKAARQWSVHEMSPVDEHDPQASRTSWHAYLDFMGQGERLAPSAIRHDWVVYSATVSKQTPVLERYGFDKARFEKAATMQEKALFESPGSPGEKAFDAVIRYEALVCSAGQPPAADISFAGQKPGAYCAAVAKDAEHGKRIHDSGFAPGVVRAAYLDPEGRKIDAQLAATAPRVIRDDVRAVVRWWGDKQRPVLARFGYDMRKILLRGSARDRGDLQLTDKKIRDHYARATAYEQEVCGQ